ncbi:MAG TPA: hypothetical protein VGL56_18255 [Fimbriimonadaceae bacterium]
MSTETVASYRLIREGSGLMPVSGFSLLEMTGEDRKEWLQGQCSNDLRNLTEGGSIKFCVCTPTGQLLSFCTLWDLPDRFLICVPTASVSALLERAETMVIMEDVVLRDVTEQFDWVSVQGPLTYIELSKMIGLDDSDVASLDPLALKNDRTGSGGYDLLIALGSELREKLTAALILLDPAAIEAARLEAGIPVFGVDTNPKTLPPELGPWFESQFISYEKGCYTGQEVLMRIHSRGHTNRVWKLLLLSAPASPGDKILLGDDEVGTITSGIVSPEFGFLAAAFLRNGAVEDGAALRVGSGVATVREFPLWAEQRAQ